MRRWRPGAATLSAAILSVSACARAEEEVPPERDGAALEEVRAQEAELRRRQEEIDRMHEQKRAMQVELRRRYEHIDRMHGIVLNQQAALEVAKKTMRDAVDKRMEVEAELKHARAEVEKLRKANVRLEKELQGLRQLVEQFAGPGAMKRVLRGAEHPPIDGKILAVRPQVDLVMLSVGVDDGVTAGLRFTVYRGQKYVGKVEVEKVFADMCSATILPEWLKEPIREGDHAASGLVAAPPPRDAGGERPAAPDGGEPKPPGDIHCKIIGVRPEVNLVMLSVGRDDGVKTGYRFTVYRGEKYIGKVDVEKVFADMSEARILKAWTKETIREGDDASSGPGEAAPGRRPGWEKPPRHPRHPRRPLPPAAPKEPRGEEPPVLEAPAEDDDAVF